jgi:hypothetical protein
MTNVSVTLKSSDKANHNVNVGLKNVTLNQMIPPGGTLNLTPDTAERQPGPVACNIHPWMQAYWMVLDHPYFGVTDEKGNYENKNAPAGSQKVVVWQEAVGFVSASGAGDEVVIKANDTTEKEWTIDPSKVRTGS